MIIRYMCFYVMALIIFVSQSQNSTLETYNKEPFFDDFNSDKVNSQTWRIATWAEHGGQTSTERCYVDSGFLNLIFINDKEKGFLSSAIETKAKFLYGKWEARLKPSSVPGVLNSMFTIDWDNTSTSAVNDGTKEEIDIEFLTFSFKPGSGEVHFAVHEEGLKSFETNPDVKLNFNPSDDFHVWGFNITSEYIEWFVDSTVLKRYEYKGNDISIGSPYNLKFNSWSAQKWINGPPQKGIKCVYQIDWVRFTPYTTGVQNIRTGYCPSGKIVPKQFKSLPSPDRNIYSNIMFNMLGQRINTCVSLTKYSGVYFTSNELLSLF